MDWGEVSVAFDKVAEFAGVHDLSLASEAQTRFDIIDRLICEVLLWQPGQISVEEPAGSVEESYTDYILRTPGHTVLVEAKKYSADFPSPTTRTRFSLTGSVLGRTEIARAIVQAEKYSKSVDLEFIVVTNGLCWCLFPPTARERKEFATLLFPFARRDQAETLWNILAEVNVAAGSLDDIVGSMPVTENRLIREIGRVDGRVDRNTIADHLGPALNRALYAEAILADKEQLEICYVATEARAKFDAQLEMHLADAKPGYVTPARRIRRDREPGALHEIVAGSVPDFAPPVTLVIGPVGAGKSTYLMHFQKVSGLKTLDVAKAHWVYVDFEQLGPKGDPRKFLYGRLLDYLNEEHPHMKTDYRSVMEPAYAAEIAGLARGPLAPIFTDKALFGAKISEHIMKDYEQVEPYVDKIYKHLASSGLVIVVLDNIDLYENEELETAVFAEGLAFSKRVHVHVIMSLRDTTFAKHKSDSVFDAYELRKLWLDPPPFRQVLSLRLSYARKILEGKSAKIPSSGGSYVQIEDLGAFFDIVKGSLLSNESGDYIDALSDLNIRRGLSLVTNFLTSGHIQADRALRAYYEEPSHAFRFPFHEVFKGTILGQWRHYREDRCDCINLFDSRLGNPALLLLRLHLVQYLLRRAASKETLETGFAQIAATFGGVPKESLWTCAQHLSKAGLVRFVSTNVNQDEDIVAITRSGGYYAKVLCTRLNYVEECMHDTAIHNSESWDQLYELTETIEQEHDVPRRMRLRQTRVTLFVEYLGRIETAFDTAISGGVGPIAAVPTIRECIAREADLAVRKSDRWFRNASP